ncbi:hypothetical protein EDB84DRAFT_1573144 [Lactarius hengduanensis]|nr:hypothetical protein EDB84DRAFT_1573144 [Lactarius hengduanensis]
MAHFDHFDLHRRRVHHPVFHRDDVVTPGTDSSNTPSPTSQGLIIPVAPTIIGDPFTTIATTPTPSSSPPPCSVNQYHPSALSPFVDALLSVTVFDVDYHFNYFNPIQLVDPFDTNYHSQSSSTPTTTPTFIQTIVNPSGVYTSTVSPSPTSSSTPVSGTSTGIIVGGIIAAILGSAGILAAVVYFLMRRFLKKSGIAMMLAGRSAAVGADAEPVRPYGAPPRPPSMIERHLNNTPSMPPRQPTLPNVYPNNAYGNGYGATNYSPNSFSPGHVVSPNSANPFFSPYAQDVMASPVSSTVPEYYDPPHPGNPAFLPQALTREPPIRYGSRPGCPSELGHRWSFQSGCLIS